MTSSANLNISSDATAVFGQALQHPQLGGASSAFSQKPEEKLNGVDQRVAVLSSLLNSNEGESANLHQTLHIKPVGRAPAPLTAQELIKRGDQARSQKQYLQAISFYTRAIDSQPSDKYLLEKAIVGRGDAYLKQEKWREAVSDLSSVIETSPDDGSAYFMRALAYTGLDQWVKAIEDHTFFIEMDPADKRLLALARLHRGGVYGRLGEWAKAIIDYTRALELSTPLDESVVQRAVAMLEEAKEQLAQSWNVKQPPNGNIGHSRNSGSTNSNAGPGSPARKAHQPLPGRNEVSEMDDNGIPSIINRSPNHVKLKQLFSLLHTIELWVGNGEPLGNTESEREFRLSLAKNKFEREQGPFYDLIEYYTTHLDYNKAELALVLAIRSVIFRKIGDFEKAHADMDRVIKIGASCPATLALASAYREAKEEKSTPSSATIPVTLEQRAWHYLPATTYRQALGENIHFWFSNTNDSSLMEELDCTLDLMPSLLFAQLTRGALHLIKGEHSFAEKDLSLLIEDKTAPLEIKALAHLKLAEMFLVTNKPNKALSSINTAKDLKTDDPELTALILLRRAEAYGCKAFDSKKPFALCIADLDAVIRKKTTPENLFLAYFLRGFLYHVHRSDDQQGCADLIKALKAKPPEENSLPKRITMIPEARKAKKVFSETLKSASREQEGLDNLFFQIASKAVMMLTDEDFDRLDSWLLLDP